MIEHQKQHRNENQLQQSIQFHAEGDRTENEVDDDDIQTIPDKMEHIISKVKTTILNAFTPSSAPEQSPLITEKDGLPSRLLKAIAKLKNRYPDNTDVDIVFNASRRMSASGWSSDASAEEETMCSLDKALDESSEVRLRRAATMPEFVVSPSVAASLYRACPTSPMEKWSMLMARKEEVLQKSIKTIHAFFLQVDSDTKKVSFTGVFNFSSLRALFRDNFNAEALGGKESFTKLYIRDMTTGIFYELEDCDEVREGSLLRAGPTSSSDDLFTHIVQLKEICALGFANLQQHKMKQSIMSANEDNRPTGNEQSGSPLHGEPLKNVVRRYSSLYSQVKCARSDLFALRNDVCSMHENFNTYIVTCGDKISQYLFGKKDTNAERRKLAYDLENSLRRVACINETVANMELDIEQITDDVVTRRCRPPEAEIRAIVSDVVSVREQLEDECTAFENVHNAYKGVWETELKKVVADEHFIETQRTTFDGLQDRLVELIGQVETLVTLLASRKPVDVNAAPDYGDNMFLDATISKASRTALMLNIANLTVDSELRVNKIEAATAARERAKKKICNLDPLLKFQRSLVEIKQVLTDVGGFVELDKKMEERHRKMIENSTENEHIER